MKKLLFFKIKEVVVQWIKESEIRFKNENIRIEIAESNNELLYIILNFKNCMATIVVAEPDFAPYRFVAFEAADVVNGIYRMIYTWYDDDGDGVEDIIKNLDKAVSVVSSYSVSESI